jgi:hypothetical protein
MHAPVDLSVFWYTYSTIARTLASAFGFLTAVCLYQLQNLNEIIRNTSEQTQRNAHSLIQPDEAQIKQLRKYIETGNIDSYILDYEKLELEKRPHDPAHGDSQERAIFWFSQLKSAVRQVKTIEKSLKYSLIITSATIVLSVIVMSITNTEVIHDFTASCILLFIIVGLMIHCIVGYLLLAMTLVTGAKGAENLERFWTGWD